jgi:hypothetical protein
VGDALSTLLTDFIVNRTSYVFGVYTPRGARVGFFNAVAVVKGCRPDLARLHWKTSVVMFLDPIQALPVRNLPFSPHNFSPLKLPANIKTMTATTKRLLIHRPVLPVKIHRTRNAQPDNQNDRAEYVPYTSSARFTVAGG